MKLLLGIVWGDYAADVTAALDERGFGVTHISSMGGFWRRGNTTLMIGVDDDKVDRAIEIIDANAGPALEPEAVPMRSNKEHIPHRATIFVLDVKASARY